MKKSTVFWTFIIIVIAISVTGAVVMEKKVNTTDETETLKQKLRDEMNYLDGKLTGMMNSLNQIVLENYIVEEREISANEGEKESTESQSESGSSDKEKSESGSQEESKGSGSSESSGKSENKQPQNVTELVTDPVLNKERNPDWKQLATETENLYSSWSTILLDLYKLDINRDNILKFSSLLDQLTLNIKNEKKVESLNVLTQMYSCIVGYIDTIAESDELYKNVAKTRENVFYAYAQVEQENWEEVQTQLQNAENIYLAVVNHIYNKEKEFTINKVYITLKELQNGINEKDKDVFYIKYKNLLEELNFLMG